MIALKGLQKAQDLERVLLTPLDSALCCIPFGYALVVSGGPGSGKSTLLSQIASQAGQYSKARKKGPVIWATGEEQADTHVISRFLSTGLPTDWIYCIDTSSSSTCTNRNGDLDIDRVIALAEKEKASFLFLDSVQTAYTDKFSDSVGMGIYVSIAVTKWAQKNSGIAFMVSQENKEGKAAGSNQILHKPDATLSLERDEKQDNRRILIPTKNRFGVPNVRVPLFFDKSGILQKEE